MMASSTNDPFNDPCVVICEEIKDDNWDGGSNPPKFDFTSAKYHTGLMDKMGGRNEESKEKIRIKLNDLDTNIQSLEVKCSGLNKSISIMVTLTTITLTIWFISKGLMDEDLRWNQSFYGKTAMTSAIIGIILLLICICLYIARCCENKSLNNAVKQVVNAHFTDWKEKGIAVKLKFKPDEDGETRVRYLRISLMASEGV